MEGNLIKVRLLRVIWLLPLLGCFLSTEAADLTTVASIWSEVDMKSQVDAGSACPSDCSGCFQGATPGCNELPSANQGACESTFGIWCPAVAPTSTSSSPLQAALQAGVEAADTAPPGARLAFDTNALAAGLETEKSYLEGNASANTAAIIKLRHAHDEEIRNNTKLAFQKFKSDTEAARAASMKEFEEMKVDIIKPKKAEIVRTLRSTLQASGLAMGLAPLQLEAYQAIEDIPKEVKNWQGRAQGQIKSRDRLNKWLPQFIAVDEELFTPPDTPVDVNMSQVPSVVLDIMRAKVKSTVKNMTETFHAKLRSQMDSKVMEDVEKEVKNLLFRSNPRIFIIMMKAAGRVRNAAGWVRNAEGLYANDRGFMIGIKEQLTEWAPNKMIARSALTDLEEVVEEMETKEAQDSDTKDARDLIDTAMRSSLYDLWQERYRRRYEAYHGALYDAGVDRSSKILLGYQKPLMEQAAAIYIKEVFNNKTNLASNITTNSRYIKEMDAVVMRELQS